MDILSSLFNVLKTAFNLLKSQVSFIKYLYTYGKKAVELVQGAKGDE